MISFNPEFTIKLKRIKVPLISLKEVQSLTSASAGSATNGASNAVGGSAIEGGGDELGITPEGIPVAVEESRRHQVEAAIVRIMKARKTLVHNELIAEATRQLSHLFTPSAQVIDQQIPDFHPCA